MLRSSSGIREARKEKGSAQPRWSKKLGGLSGSLYTNSNWFAFEDDRVANERSTGSLVSPSPNTEVTGVINGVSDDNVIDGKTTDSGDPSDVLPDNEIQVELELSKVDAAEASLSTGGLEKNDETVAGHLPESTDEDPSSDPSENLIIVPYETMALPNKILDFSPVKGRL
uniref:Uncharacterized protein n=1 Tax=Quercus lobata TaxID=97700 RepID=A0A7N2N775_QUELO